MKTILERFIGQPPEIIIAELFFVGFLILSIFLI